MRLAKLAAAKKRTWNQYEYLVKRQYLYIYPCQLVYLPFSIDFQISFYHRNRVTSRSIMLSSIWWKSLFLDVYYYHDFTCYYSSTPIKSFKPTKLSNTGSHSKLPLKNTPFPSFALASNMIRSFMLDFQGLNEWYGR